MFSCGVVLWKWWEVRIDCVKATVDVNQVHKQETIELAAGAEISRCVVSVCRRLDRALTRPIRLSHSCRTVTGDARLASHDSVALWWPWVVWPFGASASK